MGTCKICNSSNVDTIGGICGPCLGKKDRSTRKKRLVTRGIVVIAIVLAASVIGINAYQSFLTSELALQMKEEVTEKMSQLSDALQEEIANIKMPEAIVVPEVELPNVDVSEIFEPEQTKVEESKQAIAYVNQVRNEAGKKSITWDSRVYELALVWTNHQYENKFFDHMDPITGICPYTMKSEFGLQKHEFVAENLQGRMYSDGEFSSYTVDIQSAVSSWMNSRGHKYNLLYDNHVAGAYACTGGVCSFMGLNYDRFGSGCATGDEGEAYWKRVGKQPGEVP